MAPALLMSLFQQHDSVRLPGKEIHVLCEAKKVATEDEEGVIRQVRISAATVKEYPVPFHSFTWRILLLEAPAHQHRAFMSMLTRTVQRSNNFNFNPLWQAPQLIPSSTVGIDFNSVGRAEIPPHSNITINYQPAGYHLTLYLHTKNINAYEALDNAYSFAMVDSVTVIAMWNTVTQS
ncbi:hypothetical protein B0H11DRAFT_1914007 [Mycena galericulata]|nr:hypothetical protein B0H11DRAFT_1914007 [Mycena galericulata]